MKTIANPLLQDMHITWDMYQPRYQELLDREVAAQDITQFLVDWGRLESELDEIRTIRQLITHLNTADQAAEASHLAYISEIQPHRERASAALKEKLLGLDHSDLPEDAVRMLLRFQADQRVFCEENLPVQQQLSDLEQEYARLNGSLRVHFKGEDLPMRRILPFLMSPDRDLREEAWRALQKTRMDAAPQLDDLFLKMLKLRRELARNAGYASFRDYMWDSYHRFDYTPEDCFQFHQTILQEVVPLTTELLEQHRKGLGLEVLKPWDFVWSAQLDPQNRPPLKPFETTEELEEKAQQVFFNLHPRLGEIFRTLREAQAMDLGTRENKMSQAYCTALPVRKLPFLFQSVVGTVNDVITTVHESGHAFHRHTTMRTQRFPWNHRASTEFVEIPSMAMEFLTLDHLGVFYSPQELERVRQETTSRSLHGLPWMCFLDAFQHWVYAEAPQEVTIDMLDQKCTELLAQFQPLPDWEGFEADRGKVWQYFHVFYVPFYYIEYAFCGLGALQMWQNQQRDPDRTLQQYFDAIEAGNSISVPQLYEKAGLNFRFDPQTVRDLMNFVRTQL
ncbi:M3 family oligoendopeptidase [Deinococcus cellulosilyticus]|uniref:Oligoendopeptidase F n=1 Tax=Deinococcus cellulosilyticus (strain DSM 18568 / NBRC 106333 / KACC 11606 / 5516J-15) TaxID=1223518 RepID=A0A511N5P4_DEIC1|nr:M3 family oligoendopeptidase [Deinococcus cellulosilyticus]GEM47721.1 oligoendopeptidase F [Deinococcus cellulosilyticus NBRC 106333 = KACC 11606]